MIVPRLRSEARGGSSSGSSTRYSNGVYGSKVSHGQHSNDPDLKRALQHSFTSQAVRKWEKRWVVIHETSTRVHKWMPAPATVPTLTSQIHDDQTAERTNENSDQQHEENSVSQQELEESVLKNRQDTQMMVDEESTSQT